jgi:hypothetical protein
LDGLLDASSTEGSGVLPKSNGATTIGAYLVDVDYFGGGIDEVRMYNRALTTEEIWNLYQFGKPDTVNSASTQPQGGNRLNSGLAGYWKFDEGAGTNATDASVNGNNGTLVNAPTWTTGQIGGALSFADASNNYVQVPAAANINLGNQTYSIGAWVYLTAYNTSYASAVFAQDASNGFDFAITGNLAAPAGRMFMHVFFPDNAVYGGTSMTLNAWHHVVATYDNVAQVVALYLDGKREGGGSLPRSTTPVAGDTFLGTDGRTGNQGQYTPDGKLDEIRLYKRVLSPEEVTDLYRLTTPTGVDTSLKGYWGFNGKDIAGTSAYDRSGIGNNGTFDGTPIPTEGKVGQAMLFNGTDEGITTVDRDYFSPAVNDMTVSFWANVPALTTPRTSGACGGTGRYFIGKDEAMVSADWGFENDNNDRICFDAWQQNGSNHAFLSASRTVNDGAWHHYAGTIDYLNRMELFIDGVSVDSTTTFIGTMVNSTKQVQLGRRGDGNYMSGALDEVRIYSRVLSTDEIRGLYNTGR